MRPAGEIEADDAMPHPSVGAPASAWDAWCERLAPGEWDDASVFRWLSGLAHASSGLVVPADIADEGRVTGPSRVVLAALLAAGDLSGVDPLPCVTARLFGHEESALGSIVAAALVELERAGLLSRTRAGGVML